MKKPTRLTAAFVPLFAFFVVAAAATPVYADKDKGYTCGTDGYGKAIQTSIDLGAFCNGSGASPLTAMTLWGINFLAAGVGAAVIFGIVWGGAVIAMSDGDAPKIKEGREIIINAVIGLFLFMFMWAGPNFLVPGGLFK